MAKNVLYKGDCLIESDKIEIGTVDLILNQSMQKWETNEPK